ncbi:hypothetical protein WNZ14_16815 [Hoeflea sp. AS60]|uniref:hypothetical protein n=1 Tax=Hoeflea sp. AS60 TaxID=3135780 RepID=UPI00317CCDF1
MIRTIGLVCLIAGVIQGCADGGLIDEVRTAEKRELPPIKVSGTTYEVYELSRSTNYKLTPKDDPNATFAVYVVVGPGMKLYCGTTSAGCEKEIRDFRAKPYKAKKSKKPRKAKKSEKPYISKREILDGM